MRRWWRWQSMCLAAAVVLVVAGITGWTWLLAVALVVGLLAAAVIPPPP